MITRDISDELKTQLNEFPVVTVLGPRQSGKTTLVRHLFPGYKYLSLEDPEIRAIAEEDPKGFLSKNREHVIFDEIQRTPHLLSYLQGLVDENKKVGQFILTGSHQLALRESITQSLAGRTGILNLLPLSIHELESEEISFKSFGGYLYSGFLPRVYDQNQRPSTAYSSYYQTYVERDVRQLIQLKDSGHFEKFMKLLAGRVGQIINYESLANDVGVDAKTIRHWLCILEASFIVFKLAPYYENFGKRVIKSPKYYFTETGLLAFLLGIETPEQVERDPLVGSLFENLVILEAVKTQYNQGRSNPLYFFRDSNGKEIDLLIPSGRELSGIEIKSSATYHRSFKKNLTSFSDNLHNLKKSYIIYSGEHHEFSDGIVATSYKNVREVLMPLRG